MNFKISSPILEKYPETEISVIFTRKIDNSSYSEEISKMIIQIEKETREKVNPEKVSEIPSIARWREVYRSFGARPGEYRNSVEALVKRVLNKPLYKINSLVDIYNYISIKYILTVGGEDLSQIKGDLLLDFASGDEEFIPLGEKDNESPWKGEVVYKDDAGVVCRCWNWREGERTKLTESTKDAVIVIENMLPEENGKLRAAEEELKSLIERYCKGTCQIFRLNKTNPEIKV